MSMQRFNKLAVAANTRSCIHTIARRSATVASFSSPAAIARRTSVAVVPQAIRSIPNSKFHSAAPVMSAASTRVSASLDPITEHNSLFFLCDIQETFRGKIQSYESLIAASVFLSKAAGVLRIPVFTTEQKPFKPTVAELAPIIKEDAATGNKVFSKSLFSMLTPEVEAALTTSHPNRRHIVLFGIETHVCVLQTSLDLLRKGYHVHLVLDAVSSMNYNDRECALERLRGESRAAAAAGGGSLVFTSSESVIYEILKDAQHPSFKACVPLVKELSVSKKGGQVLGAASPSKL